MEQNEINIGNKIIAQFMGYDIHKGLLIHRDAQTPIGNTLLPSELKYHSSWDCLLPCYKRFTDMVLNGDIELDMQASVLSDLVESSILLVNITGTFNYFSQIIVWYNSESLK